MTTSDTSFSPVPWLNVPYIRSLVEKARTEDRPAIEALLAKKKKELDEVMEHKTGALEDRELKGVTLEEIAVLLGIKSPDLSKKLRDLAKEVKLHIYGNRIVTFAPLYISNLCKNECNYCAFRASNKEIVRIAMTQKEIAEQTKILIDQGHKRILMVAGEAYQAKDDGFQYVLNSMKTIYSVKDGNGEIRRVNANVAPLSVEDFKLLREAGVGTYQCFQETYDPVVYKRHHLSGPKSDYVWRMNVFDRAIQAGIGDFGMGALLGLADWRFEALALKSHISHLEEQGSGAHTISFPRIEPATGSDVSLNPPNKVSDDDFLNMISIMRLAVPYTGMIMSTRENPEMRRKTLEVGVSQISAGSRTDPGGYSADDKGAVSGQFFVGDHRSLDEVVKELLENGFIPSWCTACETKGREGGDFLKIAKIGAIKKTCTPNALVTLKEYLLDYALPETKKVGDALIDKEVGLLEEPRNANTRLTLEKTEKGARGECF
ncbi:MAG: [FeFe] hydrogenase H-cluster radical SAM maturase HydG [Bdellovibrionales bacterium]